MISSGFFSREGLAQAAPSEAKKRSGLLLTLVEMEPDLLAC